MLTMSYKDKRVLTTDQLATILDTYTKNIRMNYLNNKDWFEEGKHFYLLKGAELKAFKAALSNYLDGRKVVANRRVISNNSVVELLESPDDATMYVPTPVIGKFANTVTLWTERGVLHHIKLINTARAWALYDAVLSQSKLGVFEALSVIATLPAADKRKSVYVVALPDKVKIGVTSDIEKRLPQISTSSGLEIVTYWYSTAMDASIAMTVEREAHEFFAGSRLKGEYFDVSFKKACVAVQRIVAART